MGADKSIIATIGNTGILTIIQRKNMKKILLLILLLTFSCNLNDQTTGTKSNLKYFLSVNSFKEIQTRHFKLFPLVVFPGMSFDTLTKFSQIDSLKSIICSDHKDLFGFIPLKYAFNNNIYFLSAFPHTCNGTFPDYKVEMIDIVLKNNEVFFESSDNRMNISTKGLEDSLISTFNYKFIPFFEKNYEIISKDNDTNRIKEMYSMMMFDYQFAIIIRLEKEEQLQKLRLPLDVVLKTYIRSLTYCMNKYYKKDINELDENELVQFSKHLFLKFEITKY